MYLQDCQAAISRFGPKLGQLYGQGESPMTITALSVRAHADFDHPRYLQRLASAGIAQSLVDVGVVDEDDRLLPNGKLGEVVVRGDAVMLGYWSNPQATTETLRNGWLHTGDIGQFDQDGFLTLKDRSKDMIISGGTNIYPREIEEVLLRHSGVAEISVIGTPDREWGEIVVAYVVSVSPNATSSQTLDEFCLANLARFKRPKHYRFISSLPKNNYGKVLKTELRRIEEKRRECESG
jgi:long-chain acyl-CoA synthetase